MVQIYGTLGPACSDAETLARLFEADMTGVRLNLSHVGLPGAAGQLERLHAAARQCGVTPQLLIDMQGPELRVGLLPAPLTLEYGAPVHLGTDIPLPPAVLPHLVPGQEVLLDDGKLLLRVSEPLPGGALAQVEWGGVLRGRKSAALPGVDIHLPAMTDSDRENLRLAKDYGVTGVMQPFVRGREDLRTVRAALDEADGQSIRLFAKIESLDGAAKLAELIPAADEIVIARGDLGNSGPLWKLPALQKRISALPGGGEALHGGHTDAGLHGAESRSHPGGGQRHFQRRAGRSRLGDGHRGDRRGEIPCGGHAVSGQHRPGGGGVFRPCLKHGKEKRPAAAFLYLWCGPSAFLIPHHRFKS